MADCVIGSTPPPNYSHFHHILLSDDEYNNLMGWGQVNAVENGPHTIQPGRAWFIQYDFKAAPYQFIGDYFIRKRLLDALRWDFHFCTR